MLEASARKQNMLGEGKRFTMDLLSETPYPRFQFTFGEGDADRDPLVIEAEDFVPVRKVNTLGKRISTASIVRITELEPTHVPETEVEEIEAPPVEDTDTDDPGDLVLEPDKE
jgi:topoisomerase-4 subunit A